MKYYTMKEFMETYGISKRTLQYYDSIGLLEAKRDEHNYRCYDEEGHLRLQCILMCRECGMTLQETASFLQPSSYTMVEKVLREKRNQLNMQIKQEEQKRSRLLTQHQKDIQKQFSSEKKPLLFNPRISLTQCLLCMFLVFDILLGSGIVIGIIKLFFI